LLAGCVAGFRSFEREPIVAFTEVPFTVASFQVTMQLDLRWLLREAQDVII
jgi:hypothetical protein